MSVSTFRINISDHVCPTVLTGFFFNLIKKKIFIVIQLQLSAFLPSTPPQPIPPPSPTSTLPLDFVLVSFIVVPVDPSPHYPLPTPCLLYTSDAADDWLVV